MEGKGCLYKMPVQFLPSIQASNDIVKLWYTVKNHAVTLYSLLYFNKHIGSSSHKKLKSL